MKKFIEKHSEIVTRSNNLSEVEVRSQNRYIYSIKNQWRNVRTSLPYKYLHEREPERLQGS